MKITGCVFDFGGVMTTTTMPQRVCPHAERLGIDWSVFTNGYEKYRRLLDGDFLTFEEMYDLIFADAGIEVSQADKAAIIEDDVASFQYRNEQTLAFMKSLKSQGYKIGILTNMTTPFVPRFRKYFADFIELADAMVISGEEKMFKPQRRIYDLLAKRIALPPNELCFFDDVQTNCDGAVACSWNAVQFTTTQESVKKFEELLSR